MTRSVKLSIGLVAIAAVVLGVVIALASGSDGDDDQTAAPAASGEADQQFAPDDSIRLSDGGPDAPVLVEFLDPECEACRAVKPTVDQLKSDHEGELTIVVRYMPLHTSSVNAAKAMEAAAAQDRFVDMYDLIYETQPEWGEQQTAEEDAFFAMAEQLGLDMDEFRAVYDDPATAAKIERDQADGEALGVTGTPTFFLDGEQLELNTVEDLVGPVREAVGS
jgi:protein-disulfide isomerase